MNLPLELIYLVREKYQFKFDDKIILRAISNGDFFILKEATRKNFNIFTFHYFISAIKTGNLEIVKSLAPFIDDGIQGGIISAAKDGHLHILKWLHNKAESCENCRDWAVDIAAEYGHIHILDWFEKNCSAKCSTRGMDWAAAKGEIKVLDWLWERNYTCSEWASELARRFNQPHSIQWLRDHHLYI